MKHWVQHTQVAKYSISPDWNNNWLHGGNLEEVIEEAHLSSDWQMKAIIRFAKERDLRIEFLQKRLPSHLMEQFEIE